MNGYIFLAFILWGFVWYFVFYLRFQNKDTINQLRWSLKEAGKEVHDLQEELEEYIAQNTLLKEEASKLLAKNDDLTDIVTELSKYYVHIKKAAEKTSELSKYLQEPNNDIVDKIEWFAHKDKVEENKKFF